MGNSYSRVAAPTEQEYIKVSSPGYSYLGNLAPARHDEAALPESVFHSMLTLERQRAERSRKPFVLMMLDAHLENGAAAGILRQAVDVVLTTKRETDLVGWYSEAAILGVIFTEVKIDVKHPVTETLRSKIETAVIKHLGPVKAAKIFLSLHVFPESWEQDDSGRLASANLCPDLDYGV
jgi:hypothetical protein